jgi:homoserine dehydrogenase
VTTSQSRRIPIVLSGYGGVGAAYAEQLCARADTLEQLHGVRLRLAAILASTTECLVENGTENSVVPPRSQWRPARPLDDLLAETGAVVFAQAIPSSPELADRAAQDALAALRRGAHVVTATKTHLLTHWSTLRAAAVAAGSRIRISGATGAALPAADLARVSLRGFGCRTIRACPNGTSTFILDRLATGETLPEAIAQARRCGIAEADPSADLSGKDAATKVRLLAGLLWDWDVTTTQVDLAPITAAAEDAARSAAVQGARLRAVASARSDTPGVVRVALELTRPGDPLHALIGPEKAVVYDCDDAGTVTVSGGKSSPLGAALAMLKDTLDVANVPRAFA